MSTVHLTQADETDHVFAGEPVVVGRTLRQLAWLRIKRDKLALLSIAVLVLVAIFAIFAPFICHLLQIDPYSFNSDLISDNGGLPNGHLGGVTLAHPLGVEPSTGRDILARLLYGSRTSLLIAISSTVLTVTTGVVVGIIAGNARGFTHTFLNRFMELILSFPFLLLVIAMFPVLQQRIHSLGIAEPDSAHPSNLFTSNIVTLIALLSVFGWAYLAKVIQGQVVSLREREFVEAAISIGSSTRRIIFVELLPNLWAPILVYTTLALPSLIGVEAALGYLGVTVSPPTASWGSMLDDSVGYFTVDPFYFLVPLTLLIVVVLAFNLLGDALRDALDPQADRT